MQKNIVNKKDNDFKTAEKYTQKYFNDLQKHFSLTEEQLIKLAKKIIVIIKNKNKPKKWWQFSQKNIL